MVFRGLLPKEEEEVTLFDGIDEGMSCLVGSMTVFNDEKMKLILP